VPEGVERAAVGVEADGAAAPGAGGGGEGEAGVCGNDTTKGGGNGTDDSVTGGAEAGTKGGGAGGGAAGAIRDDKRGLPAAAPAIEEGKLGVSAVAVGAAGVFGKGAGGVATKGAESGVMPRRGSFRLEVAFAVG
jgi:hypothetical protein